MVAVTPKLIECFSREKEFFFNYFDCIDEGNKSVLRRDGRNLGGQ